MTRPRPDRPVRGGGPPSALDLLLTVHIVLIGSERGSIKESGKPYHVQTVHRFTFDGNALTHIRIIAAEAE